MTILYFVLAAVWLMAGVTVTRHLSGIVGSRTNHPEDREADWLAGTVWGLAFAIAFSAWLVMRLR